VFGPGKAALVQALREAGLAVQVLAVGDDVDDVHGLLAAQTATPAGGIALVRPDSHLSASLPTADSAALLAAARRTLAITG